MKTIVASLIGLLMLVSAPKAAEKAITLTAYPPVSQSPANIILTIHIVRANENRLLSWVCDGENFGASGEQSLDGESTPATFRMDKALRGLPAGYYECAAQLNRTNDKPAIAKAHFTVG
jgi:hypothetical protein